MNESPCEMRHFAKMEKCHNYWLCIEGSRACNDFKLFYDTGKITYHDRSPNWYIDMPPQTITVRELSERCGFGKETNKLKHWLGLRTFPLIEDPLGFYFIRHIDGAIENTYTGKSSKRLRNAQAACRKVVLEAQVRESTARAQNNVGRVVRQEMGGDAAELCSEEDPGEN